MSTFILMSMMFRVLLVFSMLLNFYRFNAQSLVLIQVPSVEGETDYIWRTIQDIEFFEKNNYQVSLPDHELIEKLKKKSRSGSLTNADYRELKFLMVETIYDQTDYSKGHEKVENEAALLNRMISELKNTKYNWVFKSFEQYTVNLTLYGPGGSYNPEEGSILIFTTPSGGFKRYENPVNTIIHEIVHIGIEDSIIAKYSVSHSLKERIVDTFVKLTFGTFLPKYRVQDMGESRSDRFLNARSDLIDLDQKVQQILED
ncbi:MAG: hypothetical protein AAGA77_26010 [Bacteroidota bacterium]